MIVTLTSGAKSLRVTVELKPEYYLDMLPKVSSFGVIWIRISNPRSLGAWCIKRTGESTLAMGLPVSLMHHDPSDLRLPILIQITSKERILR